MLISEFPSNPEESHVNPRFYAIGYVTQDLRVAKFFMSIFCTNKQAVGQCAFDASTDGETIQNFFACICLASINQMCEAFEFSDRVSRSGEEQGSVNCISKTTTRRRIPVGVAVAIVCSVATGKGA